MKIIAINYPEKIDYKKDFNISFVLSVKLPVKNVEIKMNDVELIELTGLESTEQIMIGARGKDVFRDKKIILNISYTGPDKKEYSLGSVNNVEVVNVPWYIKILSIVGLI